MDLNQLAIGFIILLVIVILFIVYRRSKSSFSYAKGYSAPSSLSGAQINFYNLQVQLVGMQDWCVSMSRIYNELFNLFNLTDFSSDVASVPSILTINTIYPSNGSTNTQNIFHGTMDSNNYSGNAPKTYDSDTLWTFANEMKNNSAGGYTTTGSTYADIVLTNFFGTDTTISTNLLPAINTPASLFSGVAPMLKGTILPKILYNILWSETASGAYAVFKSFCADLCRSNLLLSAMTPMAVPAPNPGSFNTIYLVNAYYSILMSSVRTTGTVSFIYYMKDLLSAAALFMNYDAILFANGCENVKSYTDFNMCGPLLALSPQNAAYNNIQNYVDYNGYTQASINAAFGGKIYNTTGSGPFAGLSPLLTVALRLRNSVATLFNYANTHWCLSHYCNSELNQPITAGEISALGNSIVTDGTLYYSASTPSSSTSVPLCAAASSSLQAVANFPTSVYNKIDGDNFSNYAQAGNVIGFCIYNHISTYAVQLCIAALDSISTMSTDQQVTQAMAAASPLFDIMPMIMTDIITLIGPATSGYRGLRFMAMSIVNDIASSSSFNWSSAASIGFVSPTGTPVVSASPLTWTGPNSQLPVIPCASVDPLLQAVNTITPSSFSPSAFLSPTYIPISSFVSALIVQNSKTKALTSDVSTAYNSLFALSGFLLYAETELFGQYSAPSGSDFYTSPCNGSTYNILDLIATYNAIVG